MSGNEVRVWPVAPQPLGATWDGEGVNFAIFSAHATAIELCLFDRPDDQRESAHVSRWMAEGEAGWWRCCWGAWVVGRGVFLVCCCC